MANVFDQDDDVVALWRKETGALWTDSIGTNTLTPTYDQFMSADAVQFKEGAASIKYAVPKFSDGLGGYSTLWEDLDDGDQSADMPFKLATVNNEVTLSFWYRNEIFNNPGLPDEWYTEWSIDCPFFTLSIAGQVETGNADGDATLSVVFGVFGNNETKTHASLLENEKWYHITLTYEPTSYRISIQDAAGATVGVDKTGSVGIDPIYGGGWSFEYYSDGLGSVWEDHDIYSECNIDELVIFGRALAEEEIQQLGTGTYTPPGYVPPPEALAVFPSVRPAGYNPDLSWQPNDDPPGWGPDYVATGGGRWNQQLVCVGMDLIYYEALT